MTDTRHTTPHALDVAIGHRIRERRRRLGISQAGLAEAVGVTFQQIQKYERGANRVSFSRLLEIAHALDCGLANLAEGLDVDAQPACAAQRPAGGRGAMELLAAYRDIENRDLRRALLQHARSLGGLRRAPIRTERLA
jgi:transcriptional regulator with XRE-family HTH domain